MKELITAACFLTAFLLLVIVTSMLHKGLHWRAENSRKFLHLAGGILSLFIPVFITSVWYVLFLCGGAVALLFYTFFNKQLPAVHKTERVSYGSILFPAPIFFCYVAMSQSGNELLYYLPVSFLTFADTSAEIAGKKWGTLSITFFNNQKTLMGTLAFFLTAAIISAIILCGFFKFTFSIHFLLRITYLSLVAATVELISLKGFDNITMPAAVLLYVAWSGLAAN